MWKPIPQLMCAILCAILNEGPWISWHSASAQNVLPTELQGKNTMSRITLYFCENERESCMPSGDVRYICCASASKSNQCSTDTEHSMCMEDDQVYVCGYRDAIVCQYEDGRGSCIYSNSSSRSIEPLCMCKENGAWPLSDAQASQIRGSCMGNETTTESSGSYPGPPTATNAPRKSNSDGVNTIAIVLGTILGIVLLVLLVVCLLKRRGNQTPQKKATTNPTNSSGVSSPVGRAQMPDPQVLGDTEYNYAYDHWPQRNPASDPEEPKPVKSYEENEPRGSSSPTAGNSPDTREVPKYYELGQTNYGRKGGETPQGSKYYEIGQASNAAKSQENLLGPKNFELEHSRDAVTDGKNHQAPKYDEVRRIPHAEQRNNEKTPKILNLLSLSNHGTVQRAVGLPKPLNMMKSGETTRRPPKILNIMNCSIHKILTMKQYS